MCALKLPAVCQVGLSVLLSAGLINSCAEQEFAGGSGVQQAIKSPKKNTNPNGDETNGDPDGGLSTDDGGTIAECGKGQSVEDPNETYTWHSSLRAGDDIKGFINSFNRYTQVVVGALYYDAATAKFVCNLKGYLEATDFYQPGSFHSASNNNIYRWDPTQKKLVSGNAGALGNQTIHDYTCKGKLKDPCHLDKGWIFQDLP